MWQPYLSHTRTSVLTNTYTYASDTASQLVARTQGRVVDIAPQVIDL